MLNDEIIVQKSVLPFRQDFETLHLEDSQTIQEIVNKLVPFNFIDCKLVVTCNGEIVTPDKWETRKLVKGDLVSLNYIPTGGGDGKSALAVVVQIVAVVGAVITGNAALAAFAEGAFWTGTAYAAATIGITMIASMATAALMSTPTQSRSTERESQTQFIEGASNTINKYGVVPIVLGTNRMYPPQAALPYTETSGNDQYCRQLFTYGYGKLQISERKLGETPIENYDDVEMEDKLEGNLHEGTSIYANDVYQEGLNIKVTKEESPFVRTTQNDCNECEIDLTFQGLTRFNDNGGRDNTSVTFEIQYAPTGTEDWSTSSSGITIADSQTATINLTDTYKEGKIYHFHSGPTSMGTVRREPGYQKNYFIYLDTFDGQISVVMVQTSADNVEYPSVSSNKVLLGYINGKTLEYVDNRYNLVGTYVESTDDFPVTVNKTTPSETVVTVGGGTMFGTSAEITVTDATSQYLRKTKRIVFPIPGQYDIRITRLTDDSDDDRVRNDSYWTALRSITYTAPVKFKDISGTAMRIKATDQLNNTVDSFNVVATSLIKSYNPETQVWEDNQPSSNPADLFRYVLQSPAFAKYEQITDDKINLEKLQEWWVYCDSIGLTYNRVIDYEASIDEVLNDICAAGVATLSKVNNVYSVIIDNERPYVKGLVTPRNSWDYSGNINYPEIPHALRIEFRNPEAGYETDERIVYADGYDESNASLFERLQFESCTNPDLAYWYGRRYFATALLQPETHTFKMDFEHLTFDRGDRINLINDVILVGVGQGRIKQLKYDDSGNVTGFIIDDVVNIPVVENLGVRIRDNQGKGFNYYLLTNEENETNDFTFAEPLTASNAPSIGSLCAFVEDGKELDLIVSEIKREANETATITAIDYAPARFDPLEEFPEWESNITIPGDFYKPYPPLLDGEIQSDESVMIKNSDGSLTSIMIIPLKNRNEPTVLPVVRCRLRGSTEWFTASTLKRDANQVVLVGLDDGKNYDIEIRYQRQTGSQLLSDPLKLENIKFVGGSTPPADVKNFRITTTNGLSLFEWSPNEEKDISHYVIKYSADLEDVQWQSAQILVARVTSNVVTTIIHNGMYLIKAVDLLGNESVNATTLISIDSGMRNNVVENLQQHPDWLGEKINTYVSEHRLTLTGDSKEGYYYFTNVKKPSLIYVPENVKNLQLVTHYQSWTRPDLTSNGTFEGGLCACASQGLEYGDQEPWMAFNESQTGNRWQINGVDLNTYYWITFYNPKPLKVTQVIPWNSDTRYHCTDYILEGSLDNSSWIRLASGTNTVTGSNTAWNPINVSSQQTFRYLRLQVKPNTTVALMIGKIRIYATQEYKELVTQESLTTYHATGSSNVYDTNDVESGFSYHYSGIYYKDNTVQIVINRNTNKIDLPMAYTVWESVSNPPTDNANNRAYDYINNNVWYRTGTDNWQIQNVLSFPICIIKSKYYNFDSITQVFNGFGFVGNTFYMQPGVQYVVYKDGYYKTITVNNFQTYTLPFVNGTYYMVGYYDGSLGYVSSSYVDEHADYALLATVVVTSNRISSMTVAPVNKGDPLDLGEVYECYLTSDVKATVVARNRIRDIVPYVRDVPNIRTFNINSFIRSIDFVRSIEKFRTFSTAQWEVKLEMNLSRDGETWTGWSNFSASQQAFRYCRFRLYLWINSSYFVPEVVKASVTVDMPDRYESGEDVQITSASQGKTVTYDYPFWNEPSVNVTVQDGAVDDRVEFTSKNNKGFTIKVFNATLNTYVTRSFDYISAGYGRVVE